MESALSDLISQYFAPPKDTSNEINEANLTNLLFYSRWPVKDPETTLQEVLKKGPRQVCQYQFKKNDIVWICKSCQKDETCVLCNECFQDSEGKHEGHEVYFYHSQAGGCCDCGDEGAWDATGFCNKHGKNMSDPLATIPVDIQEAGRVVMSRIAQELVEYCVNIAKGFNIIELKNQCQSAADCSSSSSTLYDLHLNNDDIHDFDSVVSALRSVDISTQHALNIAETVHSEGSAAIGSPGALAVVVARAETLVSACRLHVSVVDHLKSAPQQQAVLRVLAWLHRMAEVNDGMCRMICSALSIQDIQRIYETDPRLPKKVASNLHHLFLTLMADQSFKVKSSKAYALAFSRVADLYVNGIGTQENCLFGLSVQFLNRSIYVDTMVYNYGFLTSALNSLLSILEATKCSFSHPVIDKRKYAPVLGDLKVVFSLPDTSRYFCATCLPQMLSIFRLFQGMHPQRQERFVHVEVEGRDWMYAFNLYLGFGSLFEYLVNWFVSDDSAENILGPKILTEHDGADEFQMFDASSVVQLPTVIDLMISIVTAIVEWQQQRPATYIEPDDLNGINSGLNIVPRFPIELCDEANGGDSSSSNDQKQSDVEDVKEVKLLLPEPELPPLVLPEEREEKSFHIFLHRFLASSVREGCRHAHITDSVVQLQEYLFGALGGGGADQLSKLIDHPISIIAWECEIRADLWRRNGQIMNDQIMNYSEPPFCRIFKDLDVLLIQLCASAYGINRLINHIIHRFGLFEYLSTKRIKSSKIGSCSKISEIMLLLFITIVTEVPLPAFDNQAKRVEVMLRREVVHKLVGGLAAYSELQDCVGLVPDCDKIKSSLLDSVIAQVAEWQESSNALEPPKLKLKETAWAEYDPCFTHVGERTHQSALELRPSKSNICRPMCPDFSGLPSHPGFRAVRHCMLSSPILLSIVRDMLYAYMSDRAASSGAPMSGPPASSHPHYPYLMLKREWSLRCSPSVFSKTLQLLTLVVHNVCPLKLTEGMGDDGGHCYFPGGDRTREGESGAMTVQERQRLLENFVLSPSQLQLAPQEEGGKKKRMPRSEFVEALREFGIPLTMNFDIDSCEFAGMTGRDEEAEEEVAPRELSSRIPLPPMLNTIMDIYDSINSEGSNEDIFNKQSLLWVISKMEETLSDKCGLVIEARMKQELHEKRRLEMKEKREKARERAMLAMKKNASAFVEHMEKEGLHACSDEEDEEDVDADSSHDDGCGGNGDAPQCIICRSQHRHDSIGYLGLSQVSRYLTPRGEDQCAIHLNTEKDDSSVSDLSNWDRVKKNINDNNTHLHVQLCGHAMHMECFDLFFATAIESSGRQNSLILDTSEGYFQCPFCKKLGNILLPHTEKAFKSYYKPRNVDSGDLSIAWMLPPSSDSASEKSSPAALSLVSSSTESHPAMIKQTNSSLKRVHDSLMPSTSQELQEEEESKCLGEFLSHSPDHQSARRDKKGQEEGSPERSRARGGSFSAVNSIVGLFRDITRYSQNHFNTSLGTSSNNESEGTSLLTTSENAVVVDRKSGLFVRIKRIKTKVEEDEMRFKKQSLWFRCMGDLCHPMIPSPPLRTSIQHYQLIPIRIALSLSSVAFSLAIDLLENGSYFELVVAEERMRQQKSSELTADYKDLDEDDVEDDEVRGLGVSTWETNKSQRSYSAAIPPVDREQLVLDALLGKRGSGEGNRKSKNVRLLSMLVIGIGEYVNSLGIEKTLQQRISDAVRGESYESSGSESSVAREHWIESICMSNKILNRMSENESSCFTSDDVFSLWSDANDDYTNGSKAKSDWFSMPLLAMPLIDVLIFMISTLSSSQLRDAENLVDESDSSFVENMESSDGSDRLQNIGACDIFVSHFKWICVASLVQVSIAYSAADVNMKKLDDSSNPLLLSNYPLLCEIITHSINNYNGNNAFGTVVDDLYFDTIKNIFYKWLLFLQFSHHLLSRTCPDIATHFALLLLSVKHDELVDKKFVGDERGRLSSDASDSQNCDNNSLTLSVDALDMYLAASGLEIFGRNQNSYTLSDPPVTAILTTIGLWIKALCLPVDLSSEHQFTSLKDDGSSRDQRGDVSCRGLSIAVSSTSTNRNTCAENLSRLITNRALKSSYPCSSLQQPQFIALPNSYTKLHGVITGMCSYDYPALCMTCGSVIDAGGKGMCTKHNMDCVSGVGIYFLLQDCTILLLNEARGCYYPAPYVDSHGEKHRSYRGKPLFIDTKRLKMLHKLWLSHGLANEVAAKRSSSTRVIIIGHY